MTSRDRRRDVILRHSREFPICLVKHFLIGPSIFSLQIVESCAESVAEDQNCGCLGAGTARPVTRQGGFYRLE